jgi:hypothetical protein
MSSTPNAPMSRKAALAAMYRMRDALLSALISAHQYDQQEALRTESLQALAVLTQLVHGKPQGMQHTFLCDVCLQRRSEHVAHEREKRLSTWCCTPCRDLLQAQGKLIAKEEDAHP